MNYMAVFTKGHECFLNVFFFAFGFVLALWSEKSMHAGVIANAMCTVALQSFSSHASQSKYPPTTENNSPLCVSYGCSKWCL